MAKALKARTRRVPRDLQKFLGIYACLKKSEKIGHHVALSTTFKICEIISQHAALFRNQKPMVVTIYVGFKFKEALLGNSRKRWVKVYIQKAAGHLPKGLTYDGNANNYKVIIIPHKFLINQTMSNFIAKNLV